MSLDTLSTTIANNKNENKKTKRMFSSKTEVNDEIVISSSSISIIELPEIRRRRLIYDGTNDSFILGHASNGVLGVANGIGGTQILLGDYRGATGVYDIILPGNIWNWLISSTENAYWVGASSTCTVTADTSIAFTVGEIFQSNKLSIQSNNITKATMTINEDLITTLSNLTFALSVDGTNYETVTLSNQHTFTDVGKTLYLKITASGTAQIDLKDSNGIRHLISISVQ